MILKQPVSCGESRPGPPNPFFSFRPGILGPEYPEKGTLTKVKDRLEACFLDLSPGFGNKEVVPLHYLIGASLPE